MTDPQIKTAKIVFHFYCFLFHHLCNWDKSVRSQHGSQDVHETVTIIRHLPLWCWKTRKRYLLDHKKPTPQSNTFFVQVHSALYKSQPSHPTYNNLPQHNVSHSQLSSIMWLGCFKRHHLNALCPRVQRNKRQQKPRYLLNPYPNYGGSSNTCV